MMRKRAWMVSAALIGGAASSVEAAPALVADRVIVVGRIDDGAWSDAPTEARLDQRAELAAVVIGHRGARRVVLAPAGIAKVTLSGRAVTTELLEADAATNANAAATNANAAANTPVATDTGAVRVQWSIVEPHGFRKQPAGNGATSEFYSNVSTEPRTFGRWLGYDHVDYTERIVAPWGATTRIEASVSSGEATAEQPPGLGTVRFKVELQLAGGPVLASPGAEATDTFGVLPSVHRVSIRRGDDFLGWLSSYLLVPEVFGSAGSGKNHQTERYVGADCADVLIGAMRRMGRTELAYTNVAGLPGYTRPVAGPTELDEHGAAAQPIPVAEGDLIRIDYGGAMRGHTPRDWDHVAALWQDRSDPAGPLRGAADGQLDGFDLVIHMGHPRLVIEPLARQSPATVDVLRLRDQPRSRGARAAGADQK
ncbi:MAG: hypothetical protein H7138_19615 [Myxococcales bacterium]|nr:hypothetical protein [Myxococcales bacterium]